MAAAHHQAKHSFAPRTAAGTRIAAGGSPWSPPVLARRGVALARETAEHRKATASVRDKVRDKVKTQKRTSTGRIGRRLGVGQSQCANKDFKAERPERACGGPQSCVGGRRDAGLSGQPAVSARQEPEELSSSWDERVCTVFPRRSLLLIFV